MNRSESLSSLPSSPTPHPSHSHHSLLPTPIPPPTYLFAFRADFSRKAEQNRTQPAKAPPPQIYMFCSTGKEQRMFFGYDGKAKTLGLDNLVRYSRSAEMLNRGQLEVRDITKVNPHVRRSKNKRITPMENLNRFQDRFDINVSHDANSSSALTTEHRKLSATVSPRIWRVLLHILQRCQPCLRVPIRIFRLKSA